MNKFILVLFALFLSGCASNPKNYEWYVQYGDGEKKTAYVEWYNEDNSCIGSKLYVPDAPNRFTMPSKIMRVNKEDKSEKRFSMCGEDKHPDGPVYQYHNNRPSHNVE